MNTRKTNQVLLSILVVFIYGISNLLAAPSKSVCNQFDYFYADITVSGGVKATDLYKVDFVDGDAILTFLSQAPYGAHIAYNELEKLLYVVNEDGGAIQTFDPATFMWGPSMNPEFPLNHITGAVISAHGKMLVANQADGVIYSVKFDTEPYSLSVYEPGNNISGGDLVFTDVGLYLASKSGGYFYTVLPGMPNILMGSVKKNVTGLAKAEDGETVLLSGIGSSSFFQYDISSGVTEINEYPAFLNGEIFVMSNGDMASGCSSSSQIIEECTNFEYFYLASATPGVANGTVFKGQVSGNDFVLTELFSVGHTGHLAVNNHTGELYIVNQNGKNIKTYDQAGNLLHTATISGLGSKTTAVVWRESDGLVYVGNKTHQKVFTIDPITGAKNVFAENVPVSGGDLFISNNDEVRLVERKNSGSSRVHDVTTGSAIHIYDVAKSINGAAITPSGGSIMAEGNGSNNFHLYDADGNVEGVLTAKLSNGDLFPLYDGDMASRCASYEVIEECADYKYYYIGHASSAYAAGTVFGGEIDGDNFVLTELFNAGNSGHIAFNEESGEIYVVHNDGLNIKTFDVDGNLLNTASISGLTQAFALVWHKDDGLVYVGSANKQRVYTLDPSTGEITLFAKNMPVKGGDLVSTNDGRLLLVKRGVGVDSEVYDITSGVAVHVYNVSKGINGAALTTDGGTIMSEGNGSSNFHLYDADGNSLGILNAIYENGNPFKIYDGDMASGCFSGETSVDIPPVGDCHAVGVVEFIQGTQKNGNAIPASRSNPDKALGAPERIDQLVFVSLGYGGSLTLSFDGAIINGPGADIEIVETSYNTTSCGQYPEYADVYVSIDGEEWHFAKTVCKFDGFVDISDAGDFDYVNFVKIVNNNTLTTTPDGFDVDGVVALHNCVEEEIENPAPSPKGVQSAASLLEVSNFPNPTTGSSTVIFKTAETVHTVVEVYDMNGKNIATLFEQIAQKGIPNTLTFDGSDLPNGVYIYRLTTNNETVIDKFMIAR